jgi:hypothetical protein
MDTAPGALEHANDRCNTEFCYPVFLLLIKLSRNTNAAFEVEHSDILTVS